MRSPVFDLNNQPGSTAAEHSDQSYNPNEVCDHLLLLQLLD
jgi:hypothetical protein